MNQTVSLSLTVDQVNLALKVLGRAPYDEVYQLIETIKRQGDAGLAASRMRAMMEAQPVKPADPPVAANAAE